MFKRVLLCCVVAGFALDALDDCSLTSSCDEETVLTSFGRWFWAWGRSTGDTFAASKHGDVQNQRDIVANETLVQSDVEEPAELVETDIDSPAKFGAEVEVVHTGEEGSLAAQDTDGELQLVIGELSQNDQEAFMLDGNEVGLAAKVSDADGDLAHEETPAEPALIHLVATRDDSELVGVLGQNPDPQASEQEDESEHVEVFGQNPDPQASEQQDARKQGELREEEEESVSSEPIPGSGFFVQGSGSSNADRQREPGQHATAQEGEGPDRFAHFDKLHLETPPTEQEGAVKQLHERAEEIAALERLEHERLEGILAEKEALGIELDKLRHTLAEHERLHRHRVDDLGSEIDILEAKAAARNWPLQAKLSEESALQTMVDQVRVERSTLAEERAKFEKTERAAKASEAVLRRKLAAVDSKLDRLQEEKVAGDAVLQSLKEDVVGVQETLVGLGNTQQDFQQEHVLLEDRRRHILEQKQVLAKELEQVAAAVEELVKQRSEKDAQIVSAASQRKSLSNEFKLIWFEKEKAEKGKANKRRLLDVQATEEMALQRKIEHAKSERTSLQVPHQQEATQKREKHEAKVALQSRLESLVLQRGQLREKKPDNWMETETHVVADIADAQRELAQIGTAMDALDMERLTRDNLVKAKNAELTHLEETMKQVRLEKARTEAERVELEHFEHDLAQQLASLSQQIEHLETDTLGLREERTAIDARMRTKASDSGTLREKLGAVTEEEARLHRDLVALDERAHGVAADEHHQGDILQNLRVQMKDVEQEISAREVLFANSTEIRGNLLKSIDDAVRRQVDLHEEIVSKEVLDNAKASQENVLVEKLAQVILEKGQLADAKQQAHEALNDKHQAKKALVDGADEITAEKRQFIETGRRFHDLEQQEARALAKLEKLRSEVGHDDQERALQQSMLHLAQTALLKFQKEPIHV